MSDTTFTTTTWADLGNRGLCRETAPQGWTHLHDLAVHAHKAAEQFCSLTFAEWNALVSAVASGLPVILTWGHKTPTRATVIVDQVFAPSRSTASVYLRRWGFTHPISLEDLRSVEVPEAEYTF